MTAGSVSYLPVLRGEATPSAADDGPLAGKESASVLSATGQGGGGSCKRTKFPCFVSGYPLRSLVLHRVFILDWRSNFDKRHLVRDPSLPLFVPVGLRGRGHSCYGFVLPYPIQPAIRAISTSSSICNHPTDTDYRRK